MHVVPRHGDLPPDRRGPAIFEYLGVPPDQQVPEPERTAVAARLHAALAGV